MRTIFLGAPPETQTGATGNGWTFFAAFRPGALVNFAALLSGKVPVNLNYTVSEETLASCIRQCEIKTVVTSRRFWKR